MQTEFSYETVMALECEKISLEESLVDLCDAIDGDESVARLKELSRELRVKDLSTFSLRRLSEMAQLKHQLLMKSFDLRGLQLEAVSKRLQLAERMLSDIYTLDNTLELKSGIHIEYGERDYEKGYVISKLVTKADPTDVYWSRFYWRWWNGTEWGGVWDIELAKDCKIYPDLIAAYADAIDKDLLDKEES